jgi:hypothetical protein
MSDEEGPLMSLWLIILMAVLFLALLVVPLGSRWYQGCALAFLGAVVGGGGAFGAAWYYLNYWYVKPPPRGDSDWGGFATVLVLLVGLPVVGGIAGLLLGIFYAYWLKLRTSDEVVAQVVRND